MSAQPSQQLAQQSAPRSSFNATELTSDPSLQVSYIIATPRMRLYEEYSSRIYATYLKYIAPEDIIVYSIDEVFIDVTGYLKTYNMSAWDLTMTMVRDVLYNTGITATAGIGTNLYLAKVAMDIVAKKAQPDTDGVRIAQLDEMQYREQLWDHRPLTDFWRIGRGISAKLEVLQLFTMGDVARASLDPACENLLYDTFGVNAELIIDHAWGWEPVTMADIKKYRPASKSLSTGQVLSEPYDWTKGRLIVKEMTELLALDLVRKGLLTNQIVLDIGYDTASLGTEGRSKNAAAGTSYRGATTLDYYGRKVPKPAHGTGNIDHYTSSTHVIMDTVLGLYDKIVGKNLLIRRVNIAACNLVDEKCVEDAEEKGAVRAADGNAEDAAEYTGRNIADGGDRQHHDTSHQPQSTPLQLDMFTDYEAVEREKKVQQAAEQKERKLQRATLAIQDRFGKNAVLKGMNLLEGGTTIERNGQIGGHKAGNDSAVKKQKQPTAGWNMNTGHEDDGGDEA